MLYYFAFSIFFDTPVEYRLKHSTDRLRREYATLTGRYDSLNRVMENVIARDRNVFHILFEADPYDFEEENAAQAGWNFYEGHAVDSSTIDVAEREFARTASTPPRRAVADLDGTYLRPAWQRRSTQLAAGTDNRIPAIQPDHQQAADAAHGLRTACASTPSTRRCNRIRAWTTPFPKGRASSPRPTERCKRGGASATRRRDRPSSSTTATATRPSYNHLSTASTSARASRCARGDIIALSGDTGLSLAPHLHYEVRYNGMRVDPIHYFFMELSPTEYQRLMRIAQSGMQSFD